MKIIKTISMLLILMLVGFGSVHVFADDADVVYWLPRARALYDGTFVVIIGPVIEMDEDDRHFGDISVGIQWNDWLEAYAEDISEVPYLEYDDVVVGPYSSRSEVERERRDDIGDYRRDDWEVVDTLRMEDIPEFRYFPD